jgi:hypothetical protein
MAHRTNRALYPRADRTRRYFDRVLPDCQRERNSTEVATAADVVVRALPLCNRLRSFWCAHLVLHPQRLYTISGIPNLRSFHVVNCHLSGHFYDHIYEDPMEEFTMSWWDDTTEILGVTLSPHPHQRWSSFMHLEHLRTLILAPLDPFLDQMLSDLAGRGTQFHILRSLNLPWIAVESKSLSPLLERAPFLQELRFIVRPAYRTVSMDHSAPSQAMYCRTSRSSKLLTTPCNCCSKTRVSESCLARPSTTTGVCQSIYL